MSTFQQRRCAHCGDRYSYQTSAYGEGLQEYNDDTYCQSCYKVVLDALRAVPVKYRRDWAGTSDVPAKTLVELEQERREAAEAKGGYQVRRVLPGLIDMRCPDNRHEQGVVRQDGRTYRYEYWTKQGGVDAGRVNVEVERNVLTGDIPGPWNLLDRWGTRPTFIEHPPWPDPPPATHEFRLAPIPAPETSRFDLIERVHHLNRLHQEPLVPSREYDVPGWRSFTDELLPTPGECPPVPPRVDE